MDTIVKTSSVTGTKMAIATAAMLAAGGAAFLFAPPGTVERLEECRNLQRACDQEILNGAPGAACEVWWRNDSDPNSDYMQCNMIFTADESTLTRVNPSSSGQVSNLPINALCSQATECQSGVCQNNRCVAATVDLTIGNSIGGTTLTEGGTLSVGSRVCNTGTVSTPGQVRVTTNLTLTNGTSVPGVFMLAPIASGACTDVGPVTYPQVLPGTMRLSFFVDSNNQIQEVAKNNNNLSVDITVNPTSGALPAACPQPVTGSPQQACMDTYNGCVRAVTQRSQSLYGRAWRTLCTACSGGRLNCSVIPALPPASSVAPQPTPTPIAPPAALAPAPQPTPTPVTPPTAPTPTPSPVAANDRTMSFFVTSVGNGGRGGNYGGLSGADAFCQQRAAASSIATARNKRWVAYMSNNSPRVDARDRIGNGPWYTFAGQEITRSEWFAGVPYAMLLNEMGGTVERVDGHDIVTGSESNGTLAVRDGNLHTCNDWRDGTDNYATVAGHADWDLRGEPPENWSSAHTVSCSPESFQGSAGIGRVYCFAVGNL